MTDQPSITKLPSLIAIVRKNGNVDITTPRSKSRLQKINRSLSEFMFARTRK